MIGTKIKSGVKLLLICQNQQDFTKSQICYDIIA